MTRDALLRFAMSSRFNCFRDSSSPPVVVTDSPTSSSSSSRCQPQRQVPVEVAERRCSLQDPAVQRCVATDLQPGLAARRLGGPQSRRRGCSTVQCGTVTDGVPAGWVQLGGAGGAVSGCRKELASVSSPGVSPSSSSRSLHYLLQSPVRRYVSTAVTRSHSQCHVIASNTPANTLDNFQNFALPKIVSLFG